MISGLSRTENGKWGESLDEQRDSHTWAGEDGLFNFFERTQIQCDHFPQRLIQDRRSLFENLERCYSYQNKLENPNYFVYNINNQDIYQLHVI